MKDREHAILAGGCFWCIEAVFRRLRGVERVEPGYTGGETDAPTYRDVCGGETGHAEAVRITFDPETISFEELLDVFWRVHDPTTRNRQGADIGTQYRSAIFWESEKQREIARKSMEQAAQRWPDPIVTEIVPAATFYPAEGYHHRYYEENRLQPYCRLVIDPKIAKLQREFAEKLREE